MYISCNQLKKYIEDSDKIDWLNLWKIFTIRSAEVDGVEEKGKDIKNVVVGEVKSITKSTENNKYNVIKLDIGKGNELNIVSSAPNLYVGMKVPCAVVGGSLKGISEIIEAKIDGNISEGVLASEKELGISDNHLGVMDLGKDAVVGTDIKNIIPIDDIIIEIDNKSLTNRPDMWGQYGIAREIAAITGHKLLPLATFENVNICEELDIQVIDKKNCNRYSGIKISNISKKEASIDMKVMLYYCGMRSISLLVDLSNYLMLELGQPMHTFDANKINNIIVKNTGNNKIKFKTLDNVDRDIPENTLMIYDGDNPIAIAGIMGGLDAEIKEDTTSIILESANFEKTNIRKSANAIGLRTEASTRYEKSLDPNMTTLAIMRFIQLLKEIDTEIQVASKLTDIYCNIVNSSIVRLKKTYLKKYMGYDIEKEKVCDILTSLCFEVYEEGDEYKIVAPTYRSTKDISNQADIIEEISRMYGYENFKPIPLKLDLTIQNGDNRYELEHEIKRNIAFLTNFHEVHTYLWYHDDMLKTYGINKSSNIKIINKAKNNILRDDMSLSLFDQAVINSKYYSEYGIFEIGSVMRDEGEDRILSILNICSDKSLATNYQNIKKAIYNIILKLKGKKLEFIEGEIDKNYIDNSYTLKIKLDENIIGYISTFDKKYTKECGKKMSIINLEINTEQLLTTYKKQEEYIEPSKYQVVNLDYTIISNKDEKYTKLKEILDKFKNELIIEYSLKDIYTDEMKKTTIRYTIGSNEKTLSQEDIKEFQDKFISYIKEYYDIVM